MKAITKNQVAGFTLVEIAIVVAIIGLLATIATPTWVRARTRSQTNTCINNLKQIEGAKNQWGLEAKAASTATPTYSDISGYLKSSVICPSAGSDGTFGNSYNINDLTLRPTCQRVPELHLLPDVTQ